MISEQKQIQPTLFDENTNSVEIETVILYALGDFQSRGKVLAARELPLDRLRGAFKRAAERFETAELSDEAIAETLIKLGAKIVKVPNFVAKHPFRVTIYETLAEESFGFFKAEIEKDKKQ